MYASFTVKFLWEYQVKIKSEMYIVENGSINWSISYYLLNTYIAKMSCKNILHMVSCLILKNLYETSYILLQIMIWKDSVTCPKTKWITKGKESEVILKKDTKSWEITAHARDSKDVCITRT